MDNTNLIYEIRNADGTIDYVVNLGAVLYNEHVLNISNLIIPLRSQSFFTLPEDKGKFAAVNVYYNPDDGVFVFDLVIKSDTFIQNISSDALSNYLPIAQFIIQEAYGSFDVLVVNQFSKMSTFSITQQFEQGDRGSQGPVGDTGLAGYVGVRGLTGLDGLTGFTGFQGVTGMGAQGARGPQGETGLYPSTELLYYSKFKSDSIQLVDYSVFERDLVWGSTGAGYTGVGYTGVGLGDTGEFFVPQTLSAYVVEDGIVDQCQSITYRGGVSSYTCTGFIGFTGTIQAWVRLDVPPQADFSYVVSPSSSLRYTFTDISTMSPTRWEWDLGDGGGTVTASSFSYLFSAHGDYIVTLRAYNAAGVSERSKVITV
jgi:hypothetical protein